MKHLVLLFLLFAGSFFAWRYVMSREQRRITGKWGRRTALTVFGAAAAVLLLFGVLSLNSWKVW